MKNFKINIKSEHGSVHSFSMQCDCLKHFQHRLMCKISAERRRLSQSYAVLEYGKRAAVKLF